MANNAKTAGKTELGLVQINNSFGNQTYFPLSIGFLQAYAQEHLANINDFSFKTPIYKRGPIKQSLEHLTGSRAVFFSTYNWNMNAASQIASELKKVDQEILTVFGGCEIPKDNAEQFLRDRPFIDLAVHGEGEKVFTSILENYNDRNWEQVPSLSYIDGNGKYRETEKAKRIDDLTTIPSPYLAGVFDQMMKDNPQDIWLGLWETNRGCPFQCSFCEWGSDYQKRLHQHELERVLKEVDWFSKNKVEFVFCADSNFGMLERDLDIAKQFVTNKEKFGYPKAFSVQNTKNSTEKSYQVQKTLSDGGLSKGVNLAFQSMNPDTLNAIGRKNIPNDTFHELQRRFNIDGIETFSDIILGLPEESYQTFTKGISELISGGQQNRIQFINLSILANSQMGDPEYQKKYGFHTVEGDMINIHGSLDAGTDIMEKQTLVVGTKDMPKEDWIKARTFGWMTSALYFNKLLQIPFNVINSCYDVDYDKIVEEFMKVDKKDSPIIHGMNQFFQERAHGAQKGEPEFCRSEKYLNIWWPADELSMIKICAEGNLEGFYQESQKVIEKILDSRSIDYNPGLISNAIDLNNQLIKRPFTNTDVQVDLEHNVWEIYKDSKAGNPIDVQEGKFSYLIDRSTETWDSWNEWAQKVVWYGNKRGAYVYKCKPVENASETLEEKL
ncbi:radical SAM protein [Candidatus Pacearchaeota archaeon]|nr:radical SAM protein [Candidatus Pacearchaeota archaeon]